MNRKASRLCEKNIQANTYFHLVLLIPEPAKNKKSRLLIANGILIYF